MPYTAVKPVYDRKDKCYHLDVVEDADVHAIHSGWFVYEDPVVAREGILAGRFIPSWDGKKRDLVLEHLNTVIFDSGMEDVCQ